MIKILVYRFSAFGDIAMIAPVLNELLEQNPNVEIIMVSRKNFGEVFNSISRVTFKGINLDDYKGSWGMVRLANELAKEYNPDYVADLHDVLRSKILNIFLRLKRYKVFKIDKGKKEKKALVDIWNIHKSPLKRTTERYADVFREMGFQVQLSNKLRPLYQEKSGVGIAPFAQHQGKILPLEKTFELAKKIAQQDKVYFFGGGKKEIEILSQWEKEIPNSENLAGKIKLTEEVERSAILKVMISMDSANMHFASLVGTRCISIWGQTDPKAGFLGFGQNINDAIQVSDLTCRPCSVFGNKKCYRKDWACLTEIDIQKILDKIYS